MKKEILNWQECGELTLHWPEIDFEKLKNAYKIGRKFSRFDSSKIVIASPPILLTNNNIMTQSQYIINGKHRALFAYLSQSNSETISIANSNELRYSVPPNTFGSGGLDQVIATFDNRYSYIDYCKLSKTITVKDLANKYNLKY